MTYQQIIRDLYEALKLTEWSAVYGQYRACPVCQGFEPDRGALMRRSQGHRPTCKVGIALREFERYVTR